MQPLSYIFNWTYQRYDFLWGYDIATGMTTKTIYDPCPYGYRVPSSELGALFSMGSGSAGTYGYTRTVNGQQFFFPYAGFKGVDVGLNSLISSWKYVGQKGDYQSSMYCNDADATNNGGINQYMHRSRIYVSSASSWTETNVGTYTGNMHSDFANRRTAAPVRCVKDEKIGSITATLSPSSRSLTANTQITLSYKAHSYGSAIEHIEIVATYTDTSGVEHDKTIREMSNIGEYMIDGVVSYITPSDYNDTGVIFHLIVRNEHGLIYTEEVTLVENAIEAHFNRWEDTLNNNITNNDRNFIVVGEEIRYYVNVSANSDPSSVKINGIEATQSGSFVGTGVSNTTWYITFSKATKGVYTMEVEVTSEGRSITATMPEVIVYGLNIGNRTTNLDTSGNTMYMLQNNDYTTTRMTALNTSLAANTSQNYYNLFTIEGGTIRSVAREAYLSGTNGSISFASEGTNYTITSSGNSFYIYTVSGWGWFQETYYVRQTSNTVIGISNSTSRRSWNLLPVTYDIP